MWGGRRGEISNVVCICSSAPAPKPHFFSLPPRPPHLRRRAMLLQQSRHWVTPEALGARVDEALDNPVPLYPQQQQQ